LIKGQRESRQRYGSFSWLCQQTPPPMPPRPVTARENLKRVYEGEIPYWMPIWMYDNQWIWPDVILEHPMYEADGKDWFGVEWVWVEAVQGSMVKPGTRLLSEFSKWREELRFPDLEAVDWAGDAAYQKEVYDPDRLHVFHSAEGCFERLHEVIPFDEALTALVEEPEEVQAFFTAVADYKIKVFEKLFTYYEPIDTIIYGDDWGTQRAGFFSNEMFKELIKPQAKRIVQYLRSRGKYVELHSCGLTQQYIEDIIDMGFTAWTPQAINDFDMLTEKYGRKMTFTVPVPGLDKPGITPDEARGAVREFVDKFAPRGRVVASVMVKDPAVKEAAYDELYTYSSAYYSRLRK